jgi:SNF2 family DNA or RNA helicase
VFDPWWNPAVEEQAIDRAHRIGQHKAVFVYRLVAVGTIEEKMDELKARKRELADSLFDSEGRIGSVLTEDDVKALFED